jgi:hypothetical protein
LIKYTYEIDSNNCHNCTSHVKCKKGYYQINHKTYYLHRCVYEINKGEIPKGLTVRHTRHNTNCVNPEHLIIGTHAENVADRVAAGRNAVGENNGRAKLKTKDVIEIRNDNNSKIMHLAKKFNVTPKTIRKAKNRITWKHVV